MMVRDDHGRICKKPEWLKPFGAGAGMGLDGCIRLNVQMFTGILFRIQCQQTDVVKQRRKRQDVQGLLTETGGCANARSERRGSFAMALLPRQGSIHDFRHASHQNGFDTRTD